MDRKAVPDRQCRSRLGLYPRPAERFEVILAVRPDLTRVRLELARVYYLSDGTRRRGSILKPLLATSCHLL